MSNENSDHSTYRSEEKNSLNDSSGAGSGNDQEDMPDYESMTQEEINEIMEIIRGWHENEGLDIAMQRILEQYGNLLNVEHIEYVSGRSILEWLNLFTQAHKRNLNFPATRFMFHVRLFLGNMLTYRPP